MNVYLRNFLLIFGLSAALCTTLAVGVVSTRELMQFIYSLTQEGTYLRSLAVAVNFAIAGTFLLTFAACFVLWLADESESHTRNRARNEVVPPKKKPTPGIPLEHAQDELIASLPKFKGQAREMAVQLRKHGVSPIEIANILNKEGYTTRNGKSFNGKIISQLVHYETKRKGKSTKKKEVKNEKS